MVGCVRWKLIFSSIDINQLINHHHLSGTLLFFKINKTPMHLLPWIVLGMAMCSTQALCPSCEVVVGPVRVQALSASLLRVERKGPKGTSSF